MSYSIKEEISLHYIQFTVSGQQTMADNEDLVKRIIETCKTNLIKRILVDIRGFSGQPGIFSDYELAGLAASLSWGIIDKVALVHREDSREYSTFFETAARNKGINLLAFIEDSEALDWLLSDPSL